jgi:hypothetical protein
MEHLIAEGVEVAIDKIRWRVFEGSQGYTLSPLFQYSRGDGVLHYTPSFGKQVGLPGDRLSVDYVRAVLVGYHEKSQRWLLGLHIAEHDEDPVFKVLIRWPIGNSEAHEHDVRMAARTLSRFLSCPLKVFGEKKLPKPTDDPNRTGVTGPLDPHVRRRIDLNEVKQHALDISLPLEGPGFQINTSRSGLAVRLTKQPSGGDGDSDSPVFNLVEFNFKQKRVKLIPPTGLLGSFLSGAAKEIEFQDIHNVEHRYIITEVSSNVPASDGSYMVEQLTNRHLWGVYLTLSDESLLLVQATFIQSSDLIQSRVSMVGGGNKMDTNAAEGVKYFKQHVQEQERIDEINSSTLYAAYLVANALGRHIVKTEVGSSQM